MDVTTSNLEEWVAKMDDAKNGVIIIKFSAEWCVPCKKVSPVWDRYSAACPYNVIMVEVDIDDSLDFYMFMKKKRMLKGVPTILAWFPNASRERHTWYIPDDSVSGFDEKAIRDYFARCFHKASLLAASNRE